MMGRVVDGDVATDEVLALGAAKFQCGFHDYGASAGTMCATPKAASGNILPNQLNHQFPP
jgi:hypothetical protein